MKKHLAIILFLLIFLTGLLFISCDNNRAMKDLSGLYISFTDLKPIMANTIKSDDTIQKLFDYSTPFYMNGYNFTFLYIKEDGSFYHHFSDKNLIIQETLGEIKIKNNNIVEFSGETKIIDKESTTKQTFTATMEIKNLKGKESKTLFLTYLDIKTPIKRIYASTGYEKISTIDDIMYLTFRSIKNYNMNIKDEEIMEKFPDVETLFQKAEQNIDSWKTINLQQGFYVPENDNNKSFIYIDKKRNNFIYYNNDNPIYGGAYMFEGSYSLEGKNIIIIDINRDFLPFSIIPNNDKTLVSGFENIEGIIYNKYKGENYLETLDKKIIDNIKIQPFYSPTLVELLNNLPEDE